MAFRPKDLQGWRLFNHVKNMAAHQDKYQPPEWFRAMEKVPPNSSAGLIGAKKGPIVFPDDALRRQVEKRSSVAKMLSRQGYAPLPWFFTRRPFDEAIADIKKMIRENPDKSVDEVVDMWDAKMKRLLAVRNREQLLQREDALRRARSGNAAGSGQGTDSMERHEQVITAGDSVKILHAVRDMQVESTLRYQQRIEESLRKASQQDALQLQEEYGHLDATKRFSLTTGRLKQNGLSQRVRQVFLDNIAVDEQTGEPVRAVRKPRKSAEELAEETAEMLRKEQEAVQSYLTETRIVDFAHETRLARFELERRLNPSVLRKMEAAKELDQLLRNIVNVRHSYGPPQVHYATEGENNPFDFLLTFCKSFKVGQPQSHSIDFYKDKSIYPQTFIGSSMKVHQVLQEQYDQFYEQFQRYCRLDEVQIDVGRVLRSIDLGFAEAAADEGLDDKLSTQPFAATYGHGMSRAEVAAAQSSSIAMDAPISHVLSQENTVLLETGITPPDFTPLVQSVARHNYTGFELVKIYQPKMEELFFLLEVEQYMREGTLRSHKPTYVESDWNGTTDPSQFLQSFTADRSKDTMSLSMDELFAFMVDWEYTTGLQVDRREDFADAIAKPAEFGGNAGDQDVLFGKYYEDAEAGAGEEDEEAGEVEEEEGEEDEAEEVDEDLEEELSARGAEGKEFDKELAALSNIEDADAKLASLDAKFASLDEAFKGMDVDSMLRKLREQKRE